MKKTKDLTLIAVLASILVISKEILAFLPNIELVTLLLAIYTKLLEVKKVYLICIVFCLVQMIIYGIGLWTPMYFIVWPSFVWLNHHFDKVLKGEQQIAISNALFGFGFGFLFSIPYFIIDFQLGWAGFLRGIPFDLIHGIGNYLLVLLLYEPILKVLGKLIFQYEH